MYLIASSHLGLFDHVARFNLFSGIYVVITMEKGLIIVNTDYVYI